MSSRNADDPKTGGFRPLRIIYEQGWSLALGMLVLSMLSYSWMFSKITVPNERSRIYLAVAVVDNGTLAINGPIKRFGKPIDIARHDGRYYTDKAPGSSMLGAAVYGFFRIFTEPGDWSIVELVNLMRTWVMIPLGLIGFFLIRKTIILLGISRETADVVSLGWILGTTAFHYSTAFFGHQIVAVAFLVAVFLIEGADYESKGGVSDWLRFLGAGAAVGVAGITEYQSAIPCVFFGIYAVLRAFPNPGRIAGFVLGASFFIWILLSYNNTAFGGPFELSYHHLSDRWMQAKHNQGIAGVTYPRAEAIFGSTLSLHRGLIATSPFFVFVPLGLFVMWRKGRRGMCSLLGATILYYLLFVFSAEIWYGGWGFGPRLLVPVMALMGISLAFAGDAFIKNSLFSGVLRGLVVFGLFYNQTVQAVFAELPEKAENPILDVVIPAIEAGVLSPNIASKYTDSPGLWTIAPIAFLTLLAAAIVALRGIKLINRLWRKITYSTALIVTLILMISTIWFVGPQWPDRKSKRFIDNMKRYTLAEPKMNTMQGRLKR
ncbi:MAG: hypothetical protein GY847_36885 [Proteobacteria bacterium]|nr:hypothetical protein [Pseudomonadota bacterium]